MYNNKVLKKYINHIANLNKLLDQFDYLGEHPFISKIINNKNKKYDIIFEIIQQYGGSNGSNGSVRLKKLSYDEVLKLSEADLDNDLKIDIFEYRFDSTSSIDNFDLFMEQLEQYEFRIRAKIKMLIEKRNKIKLDISELPEEIEKIEKDIQNKEAERKRLNFEKEMSIRKKNKTAEDAKKAAEDTKKADEDAKEAAKAKKTEKKVKIPITSSNFVKQTEEESTFKELKLPINYSLSDNQTFPINIKYGEKEYFMYIGTLMDDNRRIKIKNIRQCNLQNQEFNIYYLQKSNNQESNNQEHILKPLYTNKITFINDTTKIKNNLGLFAIPPFDIPLPSLAPNPNYYLVTDFINECNQIK